MTDPAKCPQSGIPQQFCTCIQCMKPALDAAAPREQPAPAVPPPPKEAK